MLAEDLARIHFVKAIGVLRGDKLLTLAAVKRGAVGRDGDDEIILLKVEALGELDSRHEVGDAGEAKQAQIGGENRVDPAPECQVRQADLSIEQQVERSGALIGYADNE